MSRVAILYTVVIPRVQSMHSESLTILIQSRSIGAGKRNQIRALKFPVTIDGGPARLKIEFPTRNADKLMENLQIGYNGLRNTGDYRQFQLPCRVHISLRNRGGYKMVRIGVVGVGGMGNIPLATHSRDVENCEFVGVADLRLDAAQTVAEKHQIRAFQDYKDL